VRFKADEVCITAGHKGYPAIVASKKTKRSKAKTQRKTRTWHSGRRKTVCFGRDSTQRRSVHCYLAFFEFVNNVRRRGKDLLHALLAILIALDFTYEPNCFTTSIWQMKQAGFHIRKLIKKADTCVA
jgi:hypothetical protein